MYTLLVVVVFVMINEMHFSVARIHFVDEAMAISRPLILLYESNLVNIRIRVSRTRTFVHFRTRTKTLNFSNSNVFDASLESDLDI